MQLLWISVPKSDRIRISIPKAEIGRLLAQGARLAEAAADFAAKSGGKNEDTAVSERMREEIIMDKKQTLQMIADISNAYGAPGFEDLAQAQCRWYSRGLGAVREDRMRNLYIEREENRGDRPRIQLDAHSDEVAFMVQAIRPNGTLQLAPLGGWVASNVPAHSVMVRNRDGEYIRGITASTPPHFMTEEQRRQPLDLSAVTVDVGAVSAAEAVKEFGIRIGEPVVPDVTFSYQEKHDLMIGKAFDNRLGCAAIIRTLTDLQGEPLQADVIGAMAAQEEVGTRGAEITSRTVKPDLAIVFEGCPADDTCLPDYEIQTGLKRGPMLRHLDKRMITNPRFQRYALDLAESLGIPVQAAVRLGGATNGAPIHLSNEGVPTIVIGIPVRYAHTHYGISAYADFEHAVQLAKEILMRADETLIMSF